MKLIKESIPYIIIIIIVILIRTYLVTPVRVNGTSMDPTLKDGEILLLNKYDNNFERFEIVVVDYNGEKLVKRVIGLPGEKVQYKNNQLLINDEIIEENFLNEKTDDYEVKDIIPENMYFVLGDNRNNSTDSRTIGLISKDDIVGSTSFALFPFNKFGFVK